MSSLRLSAGRSCVRCPVCNPDAGGMPQYAKHQWAVAHWRGLILDLAKGGAVIREASLWEENPLLEEDARPLLARMEEDGEIERFAGYYRARRRSNNEAAG
jgi:hypothetical protein